MIRCIIEVSPLVSAKAFYPFFFYLGNLILDFKGWFNSIKLNSPEQIFWIFNFVSFEDKLEEKYDILFTFNAYCLVSGLYTNIY